MLQLVIDNTSKLQSLPDISNTIQFDFRDELREGIVAGRNMINGIPRVRVLCADGSAFWIEASTIVNNLTRQEMK